MRRADRLFQIVQILQGRRLTTARQLAERLEVSERTVYRDIQDLMMSGVPIDGEAGVGYALAQGFHLPPLMFTVDEIEALSIGARMLKAWAGRKLAASADDALAKIETVLPRRRRQELREPRVFAPGFPDVAGYSQRFDQLRDAINARHKVRIGYHKLDGSRSERVLRPLGLVFWGNVWTLAAWCELREDYRTFRVDRIETCEATGEGFQETDEIALRVLLERYARHAN